MQLSTLIDVCIAINIFVLHEVFNFITRLYSVDLVSLYIYRNWLVLLLRRLVMIYYQPHQQTVQAQVLLNVCWLLGV